MMRSPLQFQTEQQPRAQLRLPKPFIITPLQTTVSTVYTADAVADFLIEHMWVSNITGGALTYTIYFVPPSNSASTINAAVVGKSLAANTSELVTVAVNHRIPAGSTIQALCSSNNGINLGGWGSDIFGEYA